MKMEHNRTADGI